MLNHKIVKIDPARCEDCNSTSVINTEAGDFCEDCNRVTVRTNKMHYERGVLPKKISQVLLKFLED